MNTYTYGQKVRFTGSFVDAAGVATDPTTIVALAKPRFGTSTSYAFPATITKTGTGVYYFERVLDAEGIWDIRMVGDGALVAVLEGEVNVLDSPFY